MKKIKAIILIDLFLWLACSIYSQTDDINLQKYFNYRQRLRDKFVVVSAGDEPGTNIPVSIYNRMDRRSNIIDFGDGNGSLQYYIAMLATEYRLFQMYHIDYTQTKNELKYALDAVNRIDRVAEMQWRGYAESNDLNGFFIRDDVPSDFSQTWGKFSGKSIESCYTSELNRPACEESKDNVWNYLPSLALVKALVDDPTINQMAKDITRRMINYMHGEDWTICPVCGGSGYIISSEYLTIPCACGNGKIEYDCWIIRNPVTGYLVKIVEPSRTIMDAGQIEYAPVNIPGAQVGFQYGFAEAAKWITGENHHYNGSENHEGAFWLTALAGYAADKWYSFLCLYTVMGKHYSDYVYSTTDHRYEHLPLIYDLLHGGANIRDDATYKGRILTLLNAAPMCGPYYYGNDDRYNDNWSAPNRLTNKTFESDNCWVWGEYSGMDYMLLHNLYWLVYQPADFISAKFPIITPFFEHGTKTNPVNNISNNAIITTSYIRSTADVSFGSSVMVRMDPGFETEKGADFRAFISNPGLFYELTTKEPSYTECTGTNALKSTKVLDDLDNQKEVFKFSSNAKTSHSDIDFRAGLTNEKLEIHLYPNPNNGHFFMDIRNNSKEDLKVEVIDLSGKQIFSKRVYQNKLDIDISKASSGIYIVKINTGKEVIIKKIIKQ